MKNAKKFLIVTLSIALVIGLFWMIPSDAIYAEGEDSAEDEDAADGSEYKESDYTYMYLVTAKKMTSKSPGYSFSYTYNDCGLVEQSDCKMGKVDARAGETTFEYDDNGNLVYADGPYFQFSYVYNKNDRIIKYDLYSRMRAVGYDGSTSCKHKPKYRKKDRSVYFPKDGSGTSSVLACTRVFFDKSGKVKKKKSNFGYSVHKYDKNNNLVYSNYSYSDSTRVVYKYKFSYKNKRLQKRKDFENGQYIGYVKYHYERLKVLKKYTKKIKEQQWRILNFNDESYFGITQPWKY